MPANRALRPATGCRPLHPTPRSATASPPTATPWPNTRRARSPSAGVRGRQPRRGTRAARRGRELPMPAAPAGSSAGSGQVVNAAPWRTARSARGQVRYPGLYWPATTGGHVIYESRLELACCWPTSIAACSPASPCRISTWPRAATAVATASTGPSSPAAGRLRVHRAGDHAQRPAHLGGRAGGRGRRLMRPLSRRLSIRRRRSARAPRPVRRARPR